jgi:5-methylcytosine-specific restriction endonuclease McrA
MLRRSNLCRYCRRPVAKRNSTLDHIIPRARGGTSARSNLTLACKTCNAFKGDRSPAELTAWMIRVFVASIVARIGGRP